MTPSEVWESLSIEERREWDYLARTSAYSARPRNDFRRLCADRDVDPNAMRHFIVGAPSVAS